MPPPEIFTYSDLIASIADFLAADVVVKGLVGILGITLAPKLLRALFRSFWRA